MFDDCLKKICLSAILDENHFPPFSFEAIFPKLKVEEKIQVHYLPLHRPFEPSTQEHNHLKSMIILGCILFLKLIELSNFFP